MKWRRPVFRFRTATLLLMVAAMALVFAIGKAYLRPARIWRRAIHATNPAQRIEAWGAARSGRIPGLGPKESTEEVAATLEDSDTEAVESAVVAYPLIETDANLAASRIALRLLDSHPGVRRLAASQLRFTVHPDGSGRDEVVPALVRALDDNDASVRRQAAISLAEIGYRVGFSSSFSPEPALRERLDDADTPVRLAAALALARAGTGEETVPLLSSFLRGHHEERCPQVDCSIAFEAMMVLASRSDRAASALIAGVYNEDGARSEDTLTAIAAVAGDYRSKLRIVSLAREALQSPDIQLQRAAQLTLARISE